MAIYPRRPQGRGGAGTRRRGVAATACLAHLVGFTGALLVVMTVGAAVQLLLEVEHLWGPMPSFGQFAAGLTLIAGGCLLLARARMLARPATAAAGGGERATI